MILITGAAGKTGQALTRALARRDAPVRALVHKPEHKALALAAGAQEVASGDLLDAEGLARAANGVSAIYHICPNVHVQEVEIGRGIVQAARSEGVPKLVFHSVLHPQIEAMPHHWRKLRVEELLFASGLEVTILQPGALMQNLLAHWPELTTHGTLPIPYSRSARFSLVDLEDVAKVGAKVLIEPGHQGATYELCGPQDLSHVDIAEILGDALGGPIEAIEWPLERWQHEARASGLDESKLEALLAMFRYYDAHGFLGNSNVLRMLLGRAPTTLGELAARLLEQQVDI